MAYVSHLGKGQTLYLDNQGNFTSLTLQCNSPGQQQSQGNSYETGRWLNPPTVFQTATGYVIRVEAARGVSYVQIQAGGMQLLLKAPVLLNAKYLRLQYSDRPPEVPFNTLPTLPTMPPMEPMQPLPPLQMGNMQMQMNPMRMQMGNMELRMEDVSPSDPPNYCSQCGQAVGRGDRFCSNCGHALSQ